MSSLLPFVYFVYDSLPVTIKVINNFSTRQEHWCILLYSH